MSSDFNGRLSSLAELLPEPGAAATESARRAMHAARLEAPWANGRRRSWFTRGPRPYLLAAAAVFVMAGAALAATQWSARDLPPFGHSDGEAFVLPATDILPGGYERSRPPRYSDLPQRPSLLFPAGVGYAKALAQYTAARTRGRILPRGVALADPLPAGKVILVSDGRVRLDPAAPLGYSATTGLVNTPYDTPFPEAPPIARCQLLLGPGDPDSPACDTPTHERAYVREGVNGRWIPSENQEAYADPLPPGSTQLSVLDRPTTPIYRFTPNDAPRFPGRDTPRVAEARLAFRTDRVTLVAVPADDDGLCLAAYTRIGGAWTCGPRASMFNRGVAFLNVRPGAGRLRISGFVGDGITRVRANDGTTARVVHNAFTMVPGDSATRFTFTGPVGTFTVTQPRGIQGPPRSPDRSKERELVGIDLEDGGHASIRVAPNRGGGLCQWLYIRGQSRANGCAGPDTRNAYDVVTGGLSPGDAGYPFVYSGQFAPEVGAVEMNFADGTSERLPLTEGFVLYEIPESRIASLSRWPVAVTTYDTDGIALVRNPLRGFAAIVRQQRPGP